MNDRPAKPPNLDMVNWIEQKHDEAMAMFLEIYLVMKRNLENRKNGCIENAAVRRKEWREYMQWRFHINWEVAEEIEKSLVAAGKIEIFGGYAKPTEEFK